MAVKIRLSRMGTKNAPMYRVVAIDSRNKRDGRALEILGAYNPRTGNYIQWHEERIAYWTSVGAPMTDAVKKLHKEYGSATETVAKTTAKAASRAAKTSAA